MKSPDWLVEINLSFDFSDNLVRRRISFASKIKNGDYQYATLNDMLDNMATDYYY